MELRTKGKKIHSTRNKVLGNFGESEAAGLILCVNENALVDA
jgi:hypothetical protein